MVLYLVLVAVVGALTWFAESSRTVTSDGDRITQRVLVFERTITADEIARASVRTDAFGAPVLVIAGRTKGQKIVIPVHSERVTTAVVDDITRTLERARQSGAVVEVDALQLL